MRYFGLIGRKLGHSCSQKWFREKFRHDGIDADYLLFEAEDIEEAFEQVSQQPGIEGINVTVPYKRDILKFCDFLSSEVKATGSANCIRFRGGRSEAYNTDIAGFKYLLSLAEAVRKFPGALILGTGGSASSVSFVLSACSIPGRFVTRTPSGTDKYGYQDIDMVILDQYPLIINATPVGMWPDTRSAPPVPYHLLTGDEVLIDLVYNPETTAFMTEGKQKGCRVFNGLPMFEKQAERSWEIWNER